MAEPDLPQPLHSGEKGLLVSDEGGDRAPWSNVSCTRFAADFILLYKQSPCLASVQQDGYTFELGSQPNGAALPKPFSLASGVKLL